MPGPPPQIFGSLLRHALLVLLAVLGESARAQEQAPTPVLVGAGGATARPGTPSASAAITTPVATPSAPSAAISDSQQLTTQARAGDVEAAARLLARGLVAELSLVDPRAGAFSSWMSRREAVGAFSSQQLYGVVLETWALSHPSILGNLALPTHLRARAFMNARSSLEPMLLFQLAESFATWNPTDPVRARELFLLGVLMIPDHADAAQRLPMLARAVEIGGSCGWKEHAQLLDQLQHESQHADPYWRGRADDACAMAALGRSPPQVGVALAAYAAAAEAYASAHSDVNRARSLAAAAQCLQPDRNPEGSWSQALPLYAEAARLYAKEGLHQEQALCAQAQAEALRPDHDAKGSWDEAKRLYLEAASAFQDAGDLSNHAHSLAAAARAAAHGDPLRSTVESRRLVREAVQAFRQLDNEAAADELTTWFSPHGQSR